MRLFQDSQFYPLVLNLHHYANIILFYIAFFVASFEIWNCEPSIFVVLFQYYFDNLGTL